MLKQNTFSLSLLWINIFFNVKQYFALSLSSGCLMALAWPTYGLAFLSFFGLIPMLFLVEKINGSSAKRKGLAVFLYSYIGFFTWNVITTWWIYNSTLFGAAFAIICNSSFYAIIFTVFRWSLTRLPRITSHLFLISFWIAFEKFHLNWDFSWPWLNLGNVFSESILWIQWYEYTGAFGGTLWVLLLNLIGLKWFRIYQKERNLKAAISGYLPNLLWIGIPIAISLVLYQSHTPSSKEVEVVVLQPNLDPYEEKYQLTNTKLLRMAEEISADYLTNNTAYLLTPEGFLDEGSGLNLSNYQREPFYQTLINFNEKHPNLSLLTGAQSYRLYPPSKEAPSPTANAIRSGGWYDIYNSVFQFEKNQSDQLYHKSKLVVGVEYMPYKAFLAPLMGEFLLDFGGTIATRGTQAYRTVFTNSGGIKTAPVVCYESIYGAYTTEYVRSGAQFLSIVTNDAWWGNTQGHQQLLSYARLRAIENRRDIARSANTGISAFINAKGEITQQLAYEEQGALKGMVDLNDNLTFYTIYGDYLARWAGFLFVLLLCIALSGRLKDKATFNLHSPA